MMRIAYLVQGLGTGGLEWMVVHLAGEIVRRGHRAVIVCYDRPGDLADEARRLGVEVALVPRCRGIDWGYALRLRRHLAQWRPDVLHMHNETALFYGTLAARLADVPVRIYTEHDGVFPRGRLRRGVNRFLVGQLTQAVAVSEAVKRLWCDHDGIAPARVMVIPNGVPDHAAGAAMPEAPGGTRPLRIGAVSRLSHEKGIDVLIEAFDELARRHDNAELVLVGDGPERPALERLATARGLSARVHFEGRRSDVPRQLALMDIYVLPSRREGLPMAILEAMAASRPIVATRVGGVPEALADGENALLTPPEDPAALASALQRLANDASLRHRLGASARRDFEARYDMGRMVDRYEAVMQKELSGGAAR